MEPANNLIRFSVEKPKIITTIMVLITLLSGAFITRITLDTDPENMLSKQDAARIFHDQAKLDFDIHDAIVLGIFNAQHPDGVFNPETLKKVDTLSKFAATLSDDTNPDRRVIERDIIAPDNVDTIQQDGLGLVRFEWLMQNPPATRKEALRIRDNALNNPLLKGTLVSEDGRALAINLPVTSKDYACTVSLKLKEKIAEIGMGDDRFYIAGLAVAEDTLGKKMLPQMALYTALSLMMTFLLLLFFFRNLQLVLSPLIISLCTVIATMGLFPATGQTLHTVSLMIPLFIPPIALAASIRILSDFFDEYQNRLDRKSTIVHVMRQLFRPMLYASLASSAGFAALAFTPFPPVQASGIFLAIGIMLSWLLNTVFIPAHIMMIKENSLINFGIGQQVAPDSKVSLLNRHLGWIKKTSSQRPWRVLVFHLGVMTVAAGGIFMIQVNDNPVKWFKKDHEIRIADQTLNKYFGGTYEANLILESRNAEMPPAKAADWLTGYLDQRLAESPAIREKVLNEILEASVTTTTEQGLIDKLNQAWETELERIAPDDDIAYDRWSTALDGIERLQNQKEIFKRPDVLQYISGLQTSLARQGYVGKSNSISDVTKMVHQKLFANDPGYFTIPDTVGGVARALTSFQKSHKPDALWHLVTPDYTRANIWLQLQSGDKKDMDQVKAAVQHYFTENPPPVELSRNWAGPASINVSWQKKMEAGLFKTVLFCFIAVFLVITLLFRSVAWGAMAMIVPACTSVVLYGGIGLIGMDYDAPAALLPLLSLGLAVDFSIHFLYRARSTMAKTGTWPTVLSTMFTEPARAISRIIVLLSPGFAPLLFAPLIPCRTDGIFLAALAVYSGLTTLWILPALLTVSRQWIFKKERNRYAQKELPTHK